MNRQAPNSNSISLKISQKKNKENGKGITIEKDRRDVKTEILLLQYTFLQKNPQN